MKSVSSRITLPQQEKENQYFLLVKMSAHCKKRTTPTLILSASTLVPTLRGDEVHFSVVLVSLCVLRRPGLVTLFTTTGVILGTRLVSPFSGGGLPTVVEFIVSDALPAGVVSVFASYQSLQTANCCRQKTRTALSNVVILNVPQCSRAGTLSLVTDSAASLFNDMIDWGQFGCTASLPNLSLATSTGKVTMYTVMGTAAATPADGAYDSSISAVSSGVFPHGSWRHNNGNHRRSRRERKRAKWCGKPTPWEVAVVHHPSMVDTEISLRAPTRLSRTPQLVMQSGQVL